MKLVTYRRDEFISCGVLTDKGVIDVPSAWPGPNPPRNVSEILHRGPECIKAIAELAGKAEELVLREDMQLLAPIIRPGKVVGLAGNYGKHIKEAGLALGLSDSPRKSTVPRPFIMPPSVITGPNSEIPWPVYSNQIDYEIELAVIIGKKARRVKVDEALDYIAGYSICNDISARSVTFKKGRAQPAFGGWDEFYDWLNGKWADGFLPLGPYLVTADEIEDMQNLEMKLSVNGKIRQQANTCEMIYPVADIVSFLSHIMTLEPGDIIATGTPAGVAMATGDFLQPGDRIECTIEKLGTLTNTLGDKPVQFYEPLR
jgi:2-keto-4-pentenoate hydratase/2-oxohepta-3-ene-1,7-dioic acid hydratase in catechol pathway